MAPSTGADHRIIPRFWINRNFFDLIGKDRTTKIQVRRFLDFNEFDCTDSLDSFPYQWSHGWRASQHYLLLSNYAFVFGWE
jgi:hypothetical protein